MTTERRAYVCEKCFEKDGVRERVFWPAEKKGVPTCPGCGGRMRHQPNTPYKGERKK